MTFKYEVGQKYITACGTTVTIEKVASLTGWATGISSNRNVRQFDEYGRAWADRYDDVGFDLVKGLRLTELVKPVIDYVLGKEYLTSKHTVLTCCNILGTRGNALVVDFNGEHVFADRHGNLFRHGEGLNDDAKLDYHILSECVCTIELDTVSCIAKEETTPYDVALAKLAADNYAETSHNPYYIREQLKNESHDFKPESLTESTVDLPNGLALNTCAHPDPTQTYRKDADKLPVGEIFNQFPLALEELAKVIAFGASKYENHSWPKIPNFVERAKNSSDRHKLARSKGEQRDQESDCLHIAHEVWNLLAMLQYQLQTAESVVKSDDKYPVNGKVLTDLEFNALNNLLDDCENEGEVSQLIKNIDYIAFHIRSLVERV